MSVDPITATVLIDGVETYGTRDDLENGMPTVLDGLSFSWGRETIVDQPDAASATLTIRQQVNNDTIPTAPMFEAIHAGAVVQIRAAGGGRDVLCWVGEITSVEVQQVSDHAIQATASCVDASALLSNITVGAEPWPQQTAQERFQAILDATGLRLHELNPDPSGRWSWQLTGEMDTRLQPIPISARDVDAQPPLDLFRSIAVSTGGILWITADDTGPYLWIEDPTQREGLKQFVIDPTTGIVTITDIGFADPDNPDLWSAADLVRDPITWTQDPAQAVTTVDVTWQLAGVDEEGEPTVEQQVVSFDDTDSITRFGVRKLSIDTELADRLHAEELAFDWIAHAWTAEWILTGLSVDAAMLTRPVDGLTDEHRLDKIMDLLDIRQRIGYRLSIGDLPAWAPTGTRQSYYVEGGSYTWETGRWKFDLNGSANAIGGSALWYEMPDEIIWTDMDPSISWMDAYGVAAPEPTTPITGG